MSARENEAKPSAERAGPGDGRTCIPFRNQDSGSQAMGSD